jgi:hypothetical protein
VCVLGVLGQVARSSENSRTGKPIPERVIQERMALAQRKEEEVERVRLKNIMARNRMKKLEAHLKAKEELAEGLHLIDFEQLKIENQSLNEKIEERNEELLKLRKKTTTTVQARLPENDVSPVEINGSVFYCCPVKSLRVWSPRLRVNKARRYGRASGGPHE